MKVTVFGANGKVGSKVVHELVKRNCQVIAFVHSHKTKFDGNVKIIQGDIKKSGDVELAIKDSEVIISALGSWGTQSKDILSTGAANIIPLAEKYRVKRLISLTGAAAKYPGEKQKWLNESVRYLFGAVQRPILADSEKHIKLLTGSKLDWTVLRSPAMVEFGAIKYKLSLDDPYPWQTIHRDAVVQATVQMIFDYSYNKKCPFIFR